MNIGLRLIGLTIAIISSVPMHSMNNNKFIFKAGANEKLSSDIARLMVTEYLITIIKKRLAKGLTGDALTAPVGQFSHPCILSDYISSNQIDVLRQLLERGVNPNGSDPNDYPLHTAVSQNNFKACRLLMHFKADVNRKNDDETPLHALASGGITGTEKTTTITQLLLLHHADPNIQNKYGLTPLMKLASLRTPSALPASRAVKMAKLLINARGNIWITSYDNHGPESRHNNKNVLEIAAIEHKKDLYKCIVDAGKLMGDPRLDHIK